MTGPNERKLEKVLSADPGQVRGAGRAWRTAAEGLQQVADALDSAQGDLADAWKGRDASAATTTAQSATVCSHRSVAYCESCQPLDAASAVSYLWTRS